MKRGIVVNSIGIWWKGPLVEFHFISFHAIEKSWCEIKFVFKRYFQHCACLEAVFHCIGLLFSFDRIFRRGHLWTGKSAHLYLGYTATGNTHKDQCCNELFHTIHGSAVIAIVVLVGLLATTGKNRT